MQLSINSKILLISSFLLVIGCKENLPEYDPANPLIGKWQFTARGNWPSLEHFDDDSYFEFINDSFMIKYNLGEKDTSEWSYGIVNDTLILRLLPKSIGFSEYYLYFFSDEFQTLRLERIAFATYNTSIYKRSN